MKSVKSEEKAVNAVDLRQKFFVLTISLFCILSVNAVKPFMAHAEGQNGWQRSPDQIVSHLKDRLSLTDEQVNKIRPIIEESMQKQDAIRKEMLQLRQSTDEKIGAVLTPEQLKEFQRLTTERRGGMRGRMQRPDRPSEEAP